MIKKLLTISFLTVSSFSVLMSQTLDELKETNLPKYNAIIEKHHLMQELLAYDLDTPIKYVVEYTMAVKSHPNQVKLINLVFNHFELLELPYFRQGLYYLYSHVEHVPTSKRNEGFIKKFRDVFYIN